MQTDLEQEAKLLLREAYARRRWVIAGFVLISLAVLAVGVFWPKTYHTSTSIYVDNQSIVGQLMEGAAVPATVADSAENAGSVILSHQNLQWVLEEGGYFDGNTTPVQREMLIDSLRARTTVSNEGENLVTIDFQDTDPQRALRTTELLAEVFIQEIRKAKKAESEAAFQFIDRQANKYEQELDRLEQQMAEAGIDPEVSQGDYSQQVANLRARVEELRGQLREAEITKSSLSQQLESYPRSSAGGNPQLQQLKAQLAELRTRFKEQHPDVIALKQQIAALEGQGGGGGTVGANDPVYQDLQRQLFAANTRIQTLTANLGQAQEKLEQLTGEADGSGQRAELLRDYRIARDTYADLLRRRETAQVSMNLDSEQQGLTLRIADPAYLPHQASGPRLLHFAIGGLLFGTAIPLGLVYGFCQVDPRLRNERRLSEDFGVPVLTTVPHMETPRESRADARGVIYSIAVVVLTVAAVAGVLLLRLQGVV